MTVKTSVRGRLRISGHGLRTLVRRGLGAGKHTLTVAFTHAGRVAARGHRKIAVTVGLVVGQQRASTRRRLTF
jgi:hypothetical protein